MAETTEKPKRKSAIDDTIYTITFQGNYYGSASGNFGGGGLLEKPYSITVPIRHGDIANNNESAKSIFKNILAPELMPIKYPDYQGLQTYHIVRTECKNSELLHNNIALMPREGIIELIEDLELPINYHLYETVEELREAVELQKREPAFYAQKEALLRTTKGARIELKSSALLQVSDLREKLLREREGADTFSEAAANAKVKSAADKQNDAKAGKGSLKDV